MSADLSVLSDLGELLFAPRGIAIVGASEDRDKLSGRPLDYLRSFGYAGEVFPVNPRRETAQGVPTFPSVAAIGRPIDLAIIVLPARLVADAISDCVHAGVGVAIVFASGLAEIGGPGSELQAEIDRRMAGSPMRLIGPNCLGTFALPNHVFATFSSAFDVQDGELRDEPIALVSQSGAVGTFIYSSFANVGGGVRYFANPGNEADVTTPELLLNLAHRDDVDILAGHLEGLRQPDVLRAAAATALAADKPLIVLKAGCTEAGRRAAAAHTASEVGDDAAFDELARDAGIIRVPGLEDVVDALLAFRPGRRAKGRRVTIVTQSGGAGVLAADQAHQHDLDPSPWPVADRAGLAGVVPSFGSCQNPIDVTGVLLTDPPLLERVLNEVINHDGTDVVLVLLGNSDRNCEVIVDALKRAYAATDKPFVVVWTGGSGRPRQWLLADGIPTYTDPARGVRALAHVVRFSLHRAAAHLPLAG